MKTKTFSKKIDLPFEVTDVHSSELLPTLVYPYKTESKLQELIKTLT